jgi:hypothetical protein
MSIQDFHAQLTTGNEQTTLMNTLRRLSTVEDLKTVIDRNPTPMGEWGVWDGGLTSE